MTQSLLVKMTFGDLAIQLVIIRSKLSGMAKMLLFKYPTRKNKISSSTLMDWTVLKTQTYSHLYKAIQSLLYWNSHVYFQKIMLNVSSKTLKKFIFFITNQKSLKIYRNLRMNLEEMILMRFKKSLKVWALTYKKYQTAKRQ